MNKNILKKIIGISIVLLVIIFVGYNISKKMESEKLTTELVELVNNNKITKIDEFLENNKDRINIDIQDKEGKTLLMKSIINKRDQITYSLIKYGINFELQDKDGMTALMYAVKYDNYGSVEELIKKCVNINLKDEDRMTLLMHAVKYDNYGILDELIKKGVNINLKDKDGMTLLMYAVKYGALNVTEALIKKSVNINCKDNQGRTALIHAIISYDESKESYDKIIKALLGAKADVKLYDNEGKPAILHAAANYELCGYNEEVITALLKAGADKNTVDNKGNGFEYYKQVASEQATKEFMSEYYSKLPKSPQIGMSAEEVRNSTWGEPQDINKTTTKYGVREQWVYSSNRYVYLENGAVTAVQE